MCPFRYAVPLAALLLALPALAQTNSPLYGITSCCPNLVVTLDPDTGSTESIAEVGGASDGFNALVGSGVYDPDQDRLFMVRNGMYIVADLGTGEVTELFDAGPFSQFAGFDAARGVLYAFTVETEADEETGTVAYTNRILSVDPATGVTNEVAVVGAGILFDDNEDDDFYFSSVSGPALLATDPERLFTIRNGRFLSVSLPDGAVDEQAVSDAADLLAYAPERGTLLTYRRFFSDDGTEASFWVYEYDPVSSTHVPLAQVGAGALVENEEGELVYEEDAFAASLGMALFDPVGDRVLLNRNGVLIEVDVTSGSVTERVALGNVRIVGAPALNPTDTESQADANALRAVAYPNPFRGNARLQLTLGHAEAVTVAVYDLVGRRVAVLHDGLLPAGPTTLDLNLDAPAGTYVVRAQGSTVDQTLRIVRVD